MTVALLSLLLLQALLLCLCSTSSDAFFLNSSGSSSSIPRDDPSTMSGVDVPHSVVESSSSSSSLSSSRSRCSRYSRRTVILNNADDDSIITTESSRSPYTSTQTATSKTTSIDANANAKANKNNNSSPIDVLGIDHVVLKVADLERMTEWYTDVLGCRVAKHNVEFKMIHLNAGSALIDLIDNAGPLGDNDDDNDDDGDNNNNHHKNSRRRRRRQKHQKLDHICLGLKEFDEAAIRDHLSSYGVAITTEVAVRYGKGGDGESLYFKDPEGNRIEIKQSRA